MAEQLVNVEIAEGAVEIVEIDGEQVEITLLGMQGPPGTPAPGAIAPISFSWGDATPALLTTVWAGKRVYVVEVVISTAFNGSGASLTVGPLASPTELMAASENDPTVVASYEANPDKLYASSTAIYLHITPGSGASAGSGQVRLQVEP